MMVFGPLHNIMGLITRIFQLMDIYVMSVIILYSGLEIIYCYHLTDLYDGFRPIA
jgi:hypothetical protein